MQAIPIGQYVLINNVPFQVIGVMTPKGASAMGSDQDDVVFIPLSTGMLRVFGQRYLRSITIAVNDLSAMDMVQERATSLLKARHSGNEDFFIRNMAELLQTATKAQNALTLLLASVAAISLVAGGIGVMNIMLVSVIERTREIGIRMATGARTCDILQQFLAEATVVSGLGGSSLSRPVSRLQPSLPVLERPLLTPLHPSQSPLHVPWGPDLFSDLHPL